MKNVMKEIWYGILILSLTACATLEKGTLLGATLGGGVGLAVSSQEGRSNEQKMTGAAIGALLGGTLGHLASKERIKKEKLNPVEPTRSEFAPKIKRPVVRKVWGARPNRW